MPYIFRFFYIVMLSLPVAANSQEDSNDVSSLNRELHVISIREGNSKTKGRIHGPEARITINRPDTSVTLFLASKRPVRWFISASEGTTVEKINLFGKEAERSEILLNNSPYIVDDLYQDIEPAQKIDRQKINQLNDNITMLTGHNYFDNYIEHLDDGSIIIDQTNADTLRAELACPYYFHRSIWQLTAPPFRDNLLFAMLNTNIGEHFLTGNGAVGEHLQIIPKPDARVVFSREGFHMNNQHFPISLDVPEVHYWPVGSAYDKKRNVLYGISSNSDGYFYQFNLDTKKWSIINGSSNMRGINPIGMLFDTAADRLLMPAWYPLSSGELLIIIQHKFGTGSARIGFDRTAFEGLSDLQSAGDSTPNITPVAVLGEKIVLLASPDGYKHAYDSERRYRDGLCGWTRLYLADMETGEVVLVHHENRPDMIKSK